MRKVVFLLVVLASLGLATGVSAQYDGQAVGQPEQQVGTVGEVYTPPPTPAPVPEYTRVQTREIRIKRTVTPRCETRDGYEEATKRVLRGDFALRNHTHRGGKSTTKVVYKTTKVVEKSSRPNVVNSYNTYKFVTPPAQSGTTTPATAGERENSMIGWIILGLVIIFGAALGFYGIGTNSARQIAEQNTRQAQSAQLATALMNQAPFQPTPGRKVSINTSILPNGGGVVRADADDKPVVVPNNSWVITPGPVAPAPPAAQQPNQAIDPAAQAAAGANA